VVLFESPVLLRASGQVPFERPARRGKLYPMRTFRVFLSSTFRDLDLEREAFRERVVPELRRLCRSGGADFQAVDLRWGISAEAGLDQRTMQICLAEVRRCLALTPRPNFVVLLGERYGWRPAPAEIPSTLFTELAEAADDGNQLLRRWYALDTNAVPASYRLLPREGSSGEWSVVEADLLAVLEDGAGSLTLAPSDRVRFGASATEQEIELGAFSADPSDRVFAYFCGSPLSGESEPAAHRLRDLRERLRTALPGQVRDYETIPLPDRVECFCDDVRRDLESVIIRQLSDPADRDDLLRERGEDDAFAREKTRLFIGRRDLLDAIEAHTVSSSRAPFAIIGASGIGKSSLMAQAAAEARERHPDTVIVSRFAGTTPQSSDTVSLLRSLCAELARAYDSDESAIPQAPEALPDHYRSLLGRAHAGRPLIVFVDALDQLADVGEDAELSWIPHELPPYARLYVSALPALTSAVGRVVPAQSLRVLEPLSPSECDDLLAGLLRDAGRTLTEPQMKAVVTRVRAWPLPLYVRLLVEQARHWRSDAGVPTVGSSVSSILDGLFDDLSRPANHGQQLVSRAMGLLAAARHGLTEDEVMENLSADPLVVDEFRARSRHPTGSALLPPIVWSRLRDDLEPYLTNRGAAGATLLTFFHGQFLEQARDRYLTPARALLHGRLASYFAAQPLYLDLGRLVPNLRKLTELVFQQVAAGMASEAQEVLTSFAFLDARVRATGPDMAIDDFDRALGAGCCTNVAALEEVRDALRARVHVLRGDPAQLASQLTGRLADTTQPEVRTLLEQPRLEAQHVWLRPVTRSLGTGSAALIRVLGGHQAVIWQVSVSPSGRYAVSAGNDNACVVWDLHSYAALHRLPHDEPAFAASITPDDRRVVCAAGSTLSLWDLPRGIRLRAQQPGAGWIRALHVTPDGQVIFGSDNGVVGRWHPDNGSVTVLIRVGFPVSCLAVLPDEETILVGSRSDFHGSDGPALEAWHHPTQAVLWTTPGRGVSSVTSMQHGRTVIAASGDGTVQLRDSATGELRHAFRVSHWWADGASVTPDDRHVVAGGVGNLVRVWDVATKELIAELKGHRNVVSTTAALPDGHRILSGSHDQEVRLWDLGRAKAAFPTAAHGSSVNALCASPDAQIVASASADQLVKLWDPIAGQCIGQLTGHQRDVWSVAFTPDGTTLLSLANGWEVIVWDVATRRQVGALRLVPRATAFARRIVPSADNRHFFCGGEMFEIDSGKVVYQLPEHETNVVAALPDGDLILFHGNGTPLRAWRLTDGEVATLAGGSPVLLDPATLITAGYELGVWDVATWTRVQIIPTGHRGQVNGLVTFPDLELAATGSGDHDIALWDIKAARRLATFTGEAPIMCCAAATGAESTVVAGDQLGNVHFLRIEGLAAP
jgi:WD40 repeat protein